MGCCWAVPQCGRCCFTTSHRRESSKVFDGVVLAGEVGIETDSDTPVSEEMPVPKRTEGHRPRCKEAETLVESDREGTKKSSTPSPLLPKSSNQKRGSRILDSSASARRLSAVTLDSLIKNANSGASKGSTSKVDDKGGKGEVTEPDNETEVQGTSDSDSSEELEAEGQVFCADDISLEKSEGSGGWIADLPKREEPAAGLTLPKFEPPSGWWEEEMEDWDLVLKGPCPSVREYLQEGTEEDKAGWETMPFPAECRGRCERGRLIDWIDELGTVPRPVLILTKKKGGDSRGGRGSPSPNTFETANKELNLIQPLLEQNSRMLANMQHRLRSAKQSTGLRSLGSGFGGRIRPPESLVSASEEPKYGMVSILSDGPDDMLSEGSIRMRGMGASHRSAPGFVNGNEDESAGMRDLLRLMDNEERRRYTLDTAFETEMSMSGSVYGAGYVGTPPREIRRDWTFDASPNITAAVTSPVQSSLPRAHTAWKTSPTTIRPSPRFE
eukprot:Hpha_TRINITY_DN11897_c0_g1::TRINITY_DN11897_c0_g1_i1::g.1986::m.1986